MSDLRILQQKSEVFADETKELWMHRLQFELKRNADGVVFVFRNVKVLHGK